MGTYAFPDTNFDLKQIAESGQCFRWEETTDGCYRIPYDPFVMFAVQDDKGVRVTTDAPEYLVSHYFDLGTNYQSIIDEIPKDDRFLLDAAQHFSGLRILRQSLWETLVSFIISQNNNIPKIKKSIEALCYKNDGLFPGSWQLNDMYLDGCGLGYRRPYIAALIGKDCFPPAGIDYRGSLEFYQSFKGIGPKVANCICLYGLHYLEACPIDTWMKKIIDKRYGGKVPEWMNSRWAGVYQQYCFCYERYLSERDKGESYR